MVKDAVEDVGPVPFLAVRFLVAAVAFAPFAARGERRTGDGRAGLLAGAALLSGYAFQTIGLQYTSAPVSAFITYLLVVMVPVIAAFVLRRPPTRPTIAGVALGRGEVLTLGCALCFAVHIVVLAEVAPRFSIARLNFIQVLVVGTACLVPGAVLGGYGFSARAWVAAVYTGVAVSGVALGLQMWGQRRVGPTRTSLLLLVEPVSAAVLGALTGEALGVGGAIGAGIILTGIVVAEVPLARRRPS